MQTPLPIDQRIPEAFELLRRHHNLVVQAPPGAGKTTRLPAALLDHGLVPAGQEILVLEPRRIAARMAATRVAAERGGRLGEEVGYRVRFERSVSPATRLCFVTEGVLVRRLQHDPELAGVAAVVLDEFHERNLDADLSLALLREAQETIRPDLRLVAMSATLEAAEVARYLRDCPILQLEGRSFPLEIRYLGRSDEPVEERAAEALRWLLEPARRGSGLIGGAESSILIFMPGAAEIHRTMARIAALAEAHGYDVLPLHGDLSPEAQQRAVRRGPRPRMVVATNVAEASITMEDCAAVIDSGLAKRARYDPARGLDRLHSEPISRSSADQRAGRAGRTGPGCCLRLYGEADYAAMPASDEPEVCRVDLSEAYLQILAWGTKDPQAFSWLTPPSAPAVDRALELLQDLGAISGSPARVTGTGRAMLEFPAHPRLARMLVEAERTECLPEASLLAALLAERDLRRPGGSFGSTARAKAPEASASSDLFTLAECWETASNLRFDPVALGSIGLDARAARRAGSAAAHFRRLEKKPRPPARLPWNAALESRLLRAVTAGYPDRIVRRRAPGSMEGLITGGMGIRLDAGSSVLTEQFFAALEATSTKDARGRFVLVRLASGVRREWLAELFPGMLRTEDSATYDEAAERIVGRRVALFRDLPLEERETGVVDPEAAAEALFQAAARRVERVLAPDRETEEFLARLRWLAQRRPGLQLPSEEAASANARLDPLLFSALRVLCRGRKSLDDLRRAPLLEALQGLLTGETRRLLESEAPAHYELPGGRRARIVYRPGEPPYLASRIQDFFGCRATPRIARGEVALVLHLLAPSNRPVQVTGDLASFWNTAYPKLRLELRRRYPKHFWPEDPMTAPPKRSSK